MSPWTAAQRAQACQLAPTDETPPHVVLHESFGELLRHFELVPRDRSIVGSSDELAAQ